MEGEKNLGPGGEGLKLVAWMLGSLPSRTEAWELGQRTIVKCLGAQALGFHLNSEKRNKLWKETEPRHLKLYPNFKRSKICWKKWEPKIGSSLCSGERTSRGWKLRCLGSLAAGPGPASFSPICPAHLDDLRDRPTRRLPGHRRALHRLRLHH